MKKITKERVLKILATTRDLSGMDLSRMDLSTMDLSKSNLSGANLSETNLFVANLSEANMSHADISYADLRYANLSGANLTRANLTNAIIPMNDEVLVVSYYDVWEPHKREYYDTYPVKDIVHAVELMNTLKKSMELKQELDSKWCADYYIDKNNNHDRIYLG